MRAHVIVFGVIGILPFAVVLLNAQEVTRRRIPVGSPELQTSDLKAFNAGWRLTVDSAGRTTTSETTTERFEATTYRGTPVWRLTQHDAAGTGGSTDLVVVTERATFAPRYVEARDARNGAFRLTEFEGMRVSTACSAHLCPPDLKSASATDTVRKVDTLAVAPFEYFAGSWGMLFAGLELASGDHLSLPVHHPVRGLLWLAVDVGAKQEIESGGRRVWAWEVRTPQQPGFVYHISESPPYWIRLEVRRPDGSRQLYERPVK